MFRLADALPLAVMAAVHKAPSVERMAAAQAALDSGHGDSLLAEPRVAESVEQALLRFDGERYRLLAWCVMPTHVHVLAAQIEGHPLSAVVQSWKSFTANAANRLLRRRGAFRAAEYYDRFMRDEAQLESTRAYIEANPVAAGLCGEPWDWRFSSAANVAPAPSPLSRTPTKGGQDARATRSRRPWSHS